MIRPLLACVLAGAAMLAGCGGPAAGGASPGDGSAGEASAAPGPLAVVASTSVWGDIAAQIGGEQIAVTSLISDPSQDPHTFQPSGRDALAVSRASLIIVNGGGYDDVLDQMVAAVGQHATVLSAVQIAAAVPSVQPDNEHIWFDLDAVAAVADHIATALADRDPADANGFRERADTFISSLDPLRRQLAGIRADHAGAAIMTAEPLPAYLAAAAGLHDITPPAFAQAMEEGVDVSPADMREVLGTIANGTVRLLMYNRQSDSAQGDQLLAAARTAHVPVLLVDELLPAGEHYQAWIAGLLRETADLLRPVTS